MESTEQLFKLFGVSIENYLFISAMVYLLIEVAKGKWPGFFMGGWRTDLLAILMSFGISWKVYYPNWEAVGAAAILCWLLPAGIHKKLKKE